jgi:hypothetical protein
MLRRRGLAVIAFAIAALFGLSTVAQASTTVSTLDLKLSSSKAGKKKKPRGVKLNFHLTLGTDDGTSPPTTKETIVSFGKGIKFNASKFPSCSQNTLNSKGPKGCPKGSKIGTGSAVALVGGSPGEPAPSTTETLKVTAFNGPGGKKYELYLQGDSPAAISQAIEGKLTKASGDYGYQLDVLIPPELQQPVPGLFAPLVDFKVKTGGTYTKTKTVKKHGKKVKVKTKYNYIETTACPKGSSGKAWPFNAALTFANDPSTINAPTTQTCK